jgi:hypothetical protein
MLRSLVIFALLGANLFWGPSVSKAQKPNTGTQENKSGKDKRVVLPTHVVIDPPLPAPAGNPEPAISDPHTTEKPLPRFERPEWVIVYITAVYAFISWLTLRAMKRQADIMKRQADVVVNKERARLMVRISAADTDLEDVFWTTRIRIKNLGPTRAFKVVCNVWIEEHSEARLMYMPKISRLNIPSVIQNEEQSVAEHSPEVRFVPEILDGSQTLYFMGNLSYEDVFGEKRGTIFGYRWKVDRVVTDGTISDKSQWVVDAKAGNVET